MPFDNPQVFILSEADEGSAVLLEISRLDNIATLKQRVQIKTGVNWKDLELFLNGSRLEDEYRIKDINLNGSCKLVWVNKKRRDLLTML
jgi:Ubiquitin family